VLGQREDNFPYAIYFVSMNLSPTKLNYTITEKELFATYMPLTNLEIISLAMRLFSIPIILPLDFL